MYKSKIDIDMHLFGKTLRQIMHDNEINCAEFAANIQLGPKYLTGVRKGKEVYNHAIYVRIVDGLKGYFSEDVYPDIREKLIRASFGDKVQGLTDFFCPVRAGGNLGHADFADDADFFCPVRARGLFIDRIGLKICVICEICVT